MNISYQERRVGRIDLPVFFAFIGSHYSKTIIILYRVDFRNKRKKGQHLNSLCAVSTLPKGKNKIRRFNPNEKSSLLRFQTE